MPMFPFGYMIFQVKYLCEENTILLIYAHAFLR
ncbi:hypothetical protein T11_3907 [Trichinella zimbabwensis]|uniref:Uncharacterized protein n=1 Tax=Trichinella zimbabwensis TaxID=268475 RepID=A0A0V1FR64_9BILA|nr:hypothetical protein T11_3907 [Trichinella zimbabwensis]